MLINQPKQNILLYNSRCNNSGTEGDRSTKPFVLVQYKNDFVIILEICFEMDTLA